MSRPQSFSIDIWPPLLFLVQKCDFPRIYQPFLKGERFHLLRKCFHLEKSDLMLIFGFLGNVSAIERISKIFYFVIQAPPGASFKLTVSNCNGLHLFFRLAVDKLHWLPNYLLTVCSIQLFLSLYLL